MSTMANPNLELGKFASALQVVITWTRISGQIIGYKRTHRHLVADDSQTSIILRISRKILLLICTPLSTVALPQVVVARLVQMAPPQKH